MAVHTLLVRFDIIGADAKQCVRTHLRIDHALMLLHLAGVRAAARNDGNSPVHMTDHAFDRLDILFQRGRRSLSRCAED